MPLVYALIAASALGAIISAIQGITVTFWMLKPLTTILIIYQLWSCTSAPRHQFTGLILAGLIACLLGDILLMNDAWFLPGMLAFLAGHGFFILAFSSLNGFSRNWLLLIPVMLPVLWLNWSLSPYMGEMTIPVKAYSIVIVIMVWQAVCLPVWRRNTVTLLIGTGGVLFLFSDSMIAITEFNPSTTVSPLIVLSTYWLSITLFAHAAIINQRSAEHY